MSRSELKRCLLRQHKNPEDRLRALRSHYAQIAGDLRRIALLSLEFKLFAIRHPEAHARLRARQQEMRTCGGDFLRKITRALVRSIRISGESAATGLGALSNALLMEHIFDPKMVPSDDVKHLLGVFFLMPCSAGGARQPKLGPAGFSSPTLAQNKSLNFSGGGFWQFIDDVNIARTFVVHQSCAHRFANRVSSLGSRLCSLSLGRRTRWVSLSLLHRRLQSPPLLRRDHRRAVRFQLQQEKPTSRKL